MSGFWGADSGAVRQQGAACTGATGTVESLMAACGAVIDAVEWVGPDAEAFRERWGGEVRSRLEQVIQQLRADGDELTRHAEEQDEVSGGDGGGLLGPGFPGIPGIPTLPDLPEFLGPLMPPMPRIPTLPDFPDPSEIWGPIGPIGPIPALPDLRDRPDLGGPFPMPETPTIPLPDCTIMPRGVALPDIAIPESRLIRCFTTPDVMPFPPVLEPVPMPSPLPVPGPAPIPMPQPLPMPRDWPLPQPLPQPLPIPDSWPLPQPLPRPDVYRI